MEPTQTFLPAGVPPKLAKLWRTTFIYPLIGMTIFQLLITMPILWHLVAAIGCILLLLLFLLFFQSDVSVAISTPEGTFEYRYLNCFGITRKTSVDLPAANASLKIVSARYWSNRRQLRLNNGMFKNKVNILQDPDYGYTAEQLDDMAEVISKYCKVNH